MAPPLPNSRLSFLWAICLLLCVAVKVGVAQQNGGPSLPLAYCAGVNTNEGFKPFHSNFQSEGRCYDNCTDIGYALAIVHEKDCWCSNTVPSRDDQKPLNDCHTKCPGYPPDYCGGDGSYAYIALEETPSSTAVGDDDSNNTPSTSAVVTTETETVQSTVENTVTLPPRPPAVSVTSESSTLDSSSTSEPLVQTVTLGGTVRTVTATPSSTGTSLPTDLEETKSGGGLATGAAVGIAVGVIAALAVVGVFVWMWCIKRRRREDAANLSQYGSPSVHGSSGMMGTPKTLEVSENRFGGGASDGSDMQAGSSWEANAKRRSHLMPIDPRLDPFAKGIYVGAQNKSHESIGSLQDNQDYSRRVHHPSRVLRAVNPDPDDD